MTIPAISAAPSYQASSAPTSQILGQHKHGSHNSKSISDVDAQSTSVASSSTSTGGVGNKVNVTA